MFADDTYGLRIVETDQDRLELQSTLENYVTGGKYLGHEF
jgi:hypothetical protein